MPEASPPRPQNPADVTLSRNALFAKALPSATMVRRDGTPTREVGMTIFGQDELGPKRILGPEPPPKLVSKGQDQITKASDPQTTLINRATDLGPADPMDLRIGVGRTPEETGHELLKHVKHSLSRLHDLEIVQGDGTERALDKSKSPSEVEMPMGPTMDPLAHPLSKIKEEVILHVPLEDGDP